MAHVRVICAACHAVIVQCTESEASIAHEAVCTECEEKGFYIRDGRLQRDEAQAQT
ncbi:MAG: hypothetical protein KatS3mg076_2726 [Candidatus Binatia bacterium]|nr:MAG: hypothetical protein KatS3mg076_2726 [Candidatus Binatia bacterium]